MYSRENPPPIYRKKKPEAQPIEPKVLKTSTGTLRKQSSTVRKLREKFGNGRPIQV